MSYEGPGYSEHSERGLSPSSHWYGSVIQNDRLEREYYADQYSDGWFSVDGDEWWGEFPSRAHAEHYLKIAFTKERDCA